MDDEIFNMVGNVIQIAVGGKGFRGNTESRLAILASDLLTKLIDGTERHKNLFVEVMHLEQYIEDF